MNWTFTLEVTGDDLPAFSARVVNAGDRKWHADYFQDGVLVGNGLIGVGHDDPPVTVVKDSLESYRKQERYWRDHPELHKPGDGAAGTDCAIVECMASAWDENGTDPPRDWRVQCRCGWSKRNLPGQEDAFVAFGRHRAGAPDLP